MSLREDIERAGGLFTQSGLARRYGISRAAMHELRHSDDFPQPILYDEVRELWLASEADEWRRHHLRPDLRIATR